MGERKGKEKWRRGERERGRRERGKRGKGKGEREGVPEARRFALNTLDHDC